MTKYILHGGNASEINHDNDSFFREMTLGTIGETLVLLNYFSRKDSEVEFCAEQDKQRFLQNSENKDLVFEVARPENLTEQLKRADIMYMRGGETKKLVQAMSLTPNLKELFQNKVIAGSSAGVYVLSKYYWENDNNVLGEGLGVFNFKVYCHYKSEDKIIIEKLLAYKETLPLLTLPNYKYVVLFE